MRAWFVLLLAPLALITPASAEVLPENALAGNASAYLAQHADDPVRWQRWTSETLALARRLGRPLFVSSGYFSCHWCYVMQRESFRDAAIATLLNTHFVPVKIDREIDTALDDALIDFVRASGGVAGWPLNVILTPAAEPWYGFVYLPPQALRDTLTGHAARTPPEPTVVTEAAAPAGRPRDDAAVHAAVQAALAREADDFEGGFGTQARFPLAPRLVALLAVPGDDAEVRGFVETTLEAIVSRGLRDHVGGGFFRYTVDPGWEEPHFEKMLADNAQLAALLLEAAEALERPEWGAVARQTLDFLLRDMRRDDGLFASSLSAIDGSGTEGGYYLWTPAQLGRALAPDELRAATRLYALGRPPRFAVGHLPRPADGVVLDAALVERVRTRLFEARALRTLPRDDKAVMAWNGLVLSAFARAAPLDERYREAGARLAERLAVVVEGGALPRALAADGAALGAGLLEDHALLAAGFAHWEDASGHGRFGRLARTLAESAWRDFQSDGRWRAGTRTLLRDVAARPLFEAAHQPSPTAALASLARRFAREDKDWAARAQQIEDAARARIDTAPLDLLGHLR